jgi:hypothetical protein
MRENTNYYYKVDRRAMRVGLMALVLFPAFVYWGTSKWEVSSWVLLCVCVRVCAAVERAGSPTPCICCAHHEPPPRALPPTKQGKFKPMGATRSQPNVMSERE